MSFDVGLMLGLALALGHGHGVGLMLGLMLALSVGPRFYELRKKIDPTEKTKPKKNKKERTNPPNGYINRLITKKKDRTNQERPRRLHAWGESARLYYNDTLSHFSGKI